MTRKQHDDQQKAEKTADKQRRIQDEQDRNDAQNSDSKSESAAQTGAREYPEPPMPAQKLEKPGDESDLDPRPQFLAPDYQGSEKLRGMSAIVTGGDRKSTRLNSSHVKISYAVFC